MGLYLRPLWENRIKRKYDSRRNKNWLPPRWYGLGREDLCPECFMTYMRFKNEVRNELNRKL